LGEVKIGLKDKLNTVLLLSIIIFSSFNILPLIILPFFAVIFLGPIAIIREFLNGEKISELFKGPIKYFALFIFVNLLYAFLIGVNIFDWRLYRHEFKFVVPYVIFIFSNIFLFKNNSKERIVNTLIIVSFFSFLWFIFSLVDVGFKNMYLYPYLGTIWEHYGIEKIYLGPYQTHNSAGGFYAVLALILLGVLRTELDLKRSVTIFLSFFLILICFFYADSRAYEISLSIISMILLSKTLKIKFLKKDSIPSNVFYNIGLIVLLSVSIISAVRTHIFMLPRYLIAHYNHHKLDQHKFEKVMGLRPHNVNTRFYLWKIALEDFMKSPIIGVGPSRFDEDSKVINSIPLLTRMAVNPDLIDTSHLEIRYTTGFLYRINTSRINIHTEQEVHNAYLQVLAEGGILMFSLFFLMFYSVLSKLISMVGSKDIWELKLTGLVFGTRNALFCLVISSFFGSHLLGVIPLTLVLAISAYLFSTTAAKKRLDFPS